MGLKYIEITREILSYEEISKLEDFEEQNGIVITDEEYIKRRTVGFKINRELKAATKIELVKKVASMYRASEEIYEKTVDLYLSNYENAMKHNLCTMPTLEKSFREIYTLNHRD